MVIYMYYLKNFFVFSILGHFLETFFYSGKDPGILTGYWTPIYGLGVCIIIFLNKIIKSKTKTKSKPLEFFLNFLIGFFVLSAMELLGGILIELIFNKTFWNYEHHLFPIFKYTSLEMSFVWGISSILFIYIIKPISEKIIPKIKNDLIIILLIIFITDLLSSTFIK